MNTRAWWAIAAPINLLVLGGAAGASFSRNGLHLTTPGLVVILFAAVFFGSALGVQIHRRGRSGTLLVAGAGGAAGAFGYFAAPMLLFPALGILERAASSAMLVFLLITPIVAGAMAAIGGHVLARGVDRYRETHGMRHAPP